MLFWLKINIFKPLNEKVSPTFPKSYSRFKKQKRITCISRSIFLTWFFAIDRYAYIICRLTAVGFYSIKIADNFVYVFDVTETIGILF